MSDCTMRNDDKTHYITIKFEFDIKTLKSNPFHIDTPFGEAVEIGLGDVFKERDALVAEVEEKDKEIAVLREALKTYRSIVQGVCESRRGTKWAKADECTFDAIEAELAAKGPLIESLLVEWDCAQRVVRNGDNLSSDIVGEQETDMKMKTPERIWIEQDDCPYFYEESELAEVGSPVTEYIRADLCRRPAPVATDTGLDTVGYTNENYTSICRGEQCCNPEYKIAVVTRSQAEELLAAELMKLEATAKVGLRLSEQIEALEADNEAKDAQIRELRDTSKQMISNWRNRAEKVEADNAALIHDLNRIKDHETQLINDNKRLQEALEMIARIDLSHLSECQEIARDALKG